MKTLLYNIKQLVQIRDLSIKKVAGHDMSSLPFVEHAYLVIEHDIISDYGLMDSCPNNIFDHKIDCTGKVVLPTWCDSHTHLVYAGNRVQEFVDRINGLTYEEIAKRGGGILNSALLLNDATEIEIYEQSSIRLEEIMKMGTGAVEIKSGYGLTVEGEVKMLRVVQQLKKSYPIKIKATFLGAHAIPKLYQNNRTEYIDLIIKEMIPAIAKENLADFIDVFLETNYFTIAETEKIVNAGIKYNLIPKIHVNQFTAFGGISACVKMNALSVDHLEIVTDEDINALQNSDTMPVALPGCSHFISIPYTPARLIIDAGLPLALASDYNPGTSPSGNMNFIVSEACIKMKMTPEEAINAATINAAYAMNISETHGSITKGKKANIIITKPITGFHEIPYSFGNHVVETVIINGKII